MQYPNRLQTALVFDQRHDILEAAVRDFARIEEMKSGAIFNVPESNPSKFYRLFNGDEELMLTFEYMDGPANADAFRGPLASTITGIMCPDIRERITTSQSHILVEVSHGVMGGVENDPKIAAFLSEVGMPKAGASKEQFNRRLEVLTLMTRIVTDHAKPTAIHWTQSDQLFEYDNFEAYASNSDAPGPLHVHPYLFGPIAAPGEPQKMGIRTFGARHWLGREILVEPNVLPWAANYETILAFLRIASLENGYIIPDGDTFGPDDRSLSYRVDYRDADPEEGELGVPFYELTPLKHIKYGFVAADHVPDENVFDDRSFPPDIMPEDESEKAELANEWREKRELAENAGGSFEVRAIGNGGAAPQPPRPDPTPTQVSAPSASNPGMPSLSGRGLRAKVFGRKGT